MYRITTVDNSASGCGVLRLIPISFYFAPLYIPLHDITMTLIHQLLKIIYLNMKETSTAQAHYSGHSSGIRNASQTLRYQSPTV